MKKLALALVCMFSVAFFASCTKTVEHPEPSIAVKTGEYYITGSVDQPTVIDYYDESAINYKYGFHVEANTETKKELKSLVITTDVTYFEEDGQEQEIYYDTIDLTGKTSYDFEDFLFVQEREIYTALEGTIKAVVTDVDNQTNTATVAFKCEYEYTPVPLVGRTIEWVRRGNNVLSADEMAEFGLMWDITFKAPFATIKPMQNATMYLCDGEDFDDIVYEDEKYTYFSNLAETATPVESYRNIDANLEHADYNDMLAIIYGDKYSLIHINHADVETGSYGTQITIIGEAK
jgi:hypothetical protein